MLCKRNLKEDGLIHSICYLSLVWGVSKHEPIIHIRFTSIWKGDNLDDGQEIDIVYSPQIVNSKSNSMNNAPSVLNSVIFNQVKVIGETDAINLTGALPGENIKIYTASGVEVK